MKKPRGPFSGFFRSVLIFLLIPSSGYLAEEGEREFERELVEGDWLYHVLDFDTIPPIDDPVSVTRKEAEAFMLDDEPVLGLMINGEARAYSLWHLDHHEVVNDTVGNRPVAVTW